MNASFVTAIVAVLASAVVGAHNMFATVPWPAWLLTLAGVLSAATAKISRPKLTLPTKYGPVLDVAWLLGVAFNVIVATPWFSAHPVVMMAVAIAGTACAQLAPAPRQIGAPLPPPPPAALLLALLSVWMAIPACATVTPVVKAVGNCTVAAVEKAAATVFARVESAIVQDNYTQAVMQLVADVGEDAVYCALQELKRQSTINAERMPAEGDPLEGVKAARAAELMGQLHHSP